MGVSDEAKNVIPVKFLRKIKNKKNFSLVNSIRGHTVYKIYHFSRYVSRETNTKRMFLFDTVRISEATKKD
jgi:hypothetical protein